MGMGGARGVVGVGENRGVEYKKTLLVRGSLLSVSVDNPSTHLVSIRPYPFYSF